MQQGRDPPGTAQRMACWFCDHRFTARHVLQGGIIRSRAERAGGPYRLFICPACGRENVCEKTARGRWFSSPNYRFSFLDYLFTQVLDPGGAETLLAAISWFRENEERRRYFFERDGDRRYSRTSFLGRLWPQAPAEPAAPAGAGRKPGGGRPRGRADADREEEARAERPRVRRIVSPHEILQVRPDASEREIREAFHRLAIHYHPDKVHHLGEEFERVANEKFRELKAAYEVLLAQGQARAQAAWSPRGKPPR